MAYKTIGDGKASEPGIDLAVGDLAAGEWVTVPHAELPFTDLLLSAVGTSPATTGTDLDILRGTPTPTNLLPPASGLHWELVLDDDGYLYGTFTDGADPIVVMPGTKIRSGTYLTIDGDLAGIWLLGQPTWTGTIADQITESQWLGEGWPTETPLYTALTTLDPSPYPIDSHTLTGVDLDFGDQFQYRLGYNSDAEVWEFTLLDTTGMTQIAQGSAEDVQGPVPIEVRSINPLMAEAFGTVVLTAGLLETGLRSFSPTPTRWVGVDTTTATLDEVTTADAKSDPGLPDTPWLDWQFAWIADEYRDTPLYWYLERDNARWLLLISDNTTGVEPFIISAESESSDTGGFTFQFGGNLMPIQGQANVVGLLPMDPKSWGWDASRYIQHNSGTAEAFDNGEVTQLELATDDAGLDIIATMLKLPDGDEDPVAYDPTGLRMAWITLAPAPVDVPFSAADYLEIGPLGIGVGSAMLVAPDGFPTPASGPVDAVFGLLMGEPFTPAPSDRVSFFTTAVEGITPAGHWYTGYYELRIDASRDDPDGPMPWLYEVLTPQVFTSGSIRTDDDDLPASELRVCVSTDNMVTWRYFDSLTSAWEVVDPEDDAEWEAGKGCLFAQNLGDTEWYIYDNAGGQIVTQEQWLLLGFDFTDPTETIHLMAATKATSWTSQDEIGGFGVLAYRLLGAGQVPSRERQLSVSGLGVGPDAALLAELYVQPVSPTLVRVANPSLGSDWTNIKVRVRQGT